MKRTLSILITLLLLWSLALPAAAAETAATLRLEKTEGTVKVSNASGKNVSITNGMRLYNGYTIATEKDSYAYVSLDSSKAVKLDASSKALVQKSGKKLELTVTAGKLFFNVTVPVEKDESLNIRTSTMVTGIRGTSGWVEVVDRFTSRVHLLEGTVTVTSTEPVTGQIRQKTINGGQSATAELVTAFDPGQQAVLTVTTIEEAEVPGFVAVEVSADPVLQEKIEALSPLSVPEIIGDAEERLEAEQESADLAQEAINEQLEEIASDEVEQVFENQPEPEDDDSPVYVTLDLNNPTAAELTVALARTDVTRVNLTDAGGAGSNLDTASYTVRSGQTLDIQSGTFTVGSGNALTVDGTLLNSGAVDVAGTMNVSGSAANSGAISITSTQSVHVLSGGSLTNNGTIQIGDGTTPGLLDIKAGSTLTNAGEKASITINTANSGSSQLVNRGAFHNSGNFEVNGENLFICADSGTYSEERTDQLYAIARRTADGSVPYLGPASKLPGWYESTVVTLGGASSGNLNTVAVTVPGAVLDLNGRTASLSAMLELQVGTNQSVQSSLTLQDSAGGGVLTPANGSSTVLSVKAGTLTLLSGKVSNPVGTAIYVDLGTVQMPSGSIAAVTSGAHVGIYVNSGTAVISGGTVDGAVCGIQTTEEGSVTVDGTAVITLTMEPDESSATEGYAVSGSFTFNGGTLRAKKEANLCNISDIISQNTVHDDTETSGYFLLTPKP